MNRLDEKDIAMAMDYLVRAFGLLLEHPEVMFSITRPYRTERENIPGSYDVMVSAVRYNQEKYTYVKVVRECFVESVGRALIECLDKLL